MEQQLPLTMPDGIMLGRWLRREALDKLETKYSEWLRRCGLPALVCVAEEYEYFLSDDVWAWIVEHYHASPGERRVMGAVMDTAARRGLIVKTGVFEKSRMSVCHRRDKALWRSLIVRKAETVVLEAIERELIVPGSEDK